MGDKTTAEDVHAVATRARDAAAELAPLPRGAKDAALFAMADALFEATDAVLSANADDVAAGRAAGTSDALVDRLTLTRERVASMATGLREIAALPDPVGEVVRGYTQPNGLEIRQIRVPIGVIAIVYEARPNVTVDAAGLTLKSGNAVLLRGSASAYRSNTALVEVLAGAVEKAGLPGDAVQLVPGTDRSSVGHLLSSRGLVDLIIPRDGAGDRDRCGQRPRLCRRHRRSRCGRAHRPQCQDVTVERLQRRRDAARASRGLRRVRAAGH